MKQEKEMKWIDLVLVEKSVNRAICNGLYWVVLENVMIYLPQKINNIQSVYRAKLNLEKSIYPILSANNVYGITE